VLELPRAQALFRATKGANSLEMLGSYTINMLKVRLKGEVLVKNNPKELGYCASLNNLPITKI
jgi:hypothetical protein